MKKALFIDRDSTILAGPCDSVDQLEFIPGVITALSLLRQKTDYEFVMLTAQDSSAPVHGKTLQILAGEGVEFNQTLVDSEDSKANLDSNYDLQNSFLIGRSKTDLGCRVICFSKDQCGADLCSADWKVVTNFLMAQKRKASVKRKTKETDISINLELDGQGQANIKTGLNFFDHMLEQLACHSGSNLDIQVQGDLEVDEHHTIEDTAIALGEAFLEALGNKEGIERYGFMLPMDDIIVKVAIDFSGRAWLNWNAEFKREKIGDMPTEMFLHFFKSFSDAAKCNLYIQAEGENEHHKIEGIFKAFARAIKQGINQDIYSRILPSTKGSL